MKLLPQKPLSNYERYHSGPFISFAMGNLSGYYFFIKDIRVSFILIRNAIIKMFFYSFFFGHLYASFASCYISPLSCFFVIELI